MKRSTTKIKKTVFILFSFLLVVGILTFMPGATAYASSTSSSSSSSSTVGPENATMNGTEVPKNFDINISSNAGSTSLSSTLQILLVLTVISLAPSILIMLTSFTRIVIVLHFTRSALGTQTTPPNQILIGLAIFLTFFIMSPVFLKINKNAIQPLSKGTITQEKAIEKGLEPLRDFMFKQTNRKDLKLFLNIAKVSSSDLKEKDDIPTTVLIPAFIISELRIAFIIGFLIYIPFIIIDMVVASTLMSMGMMMLPPTTISMPFKILLFIMADGWNLIIGQVVKSFY